MKVPFALVSDGINCADASRRNGDFYIMYKIFDAHCDTIYELSERGLPLDKNELHLDIERMSEYNTYIQVFAAFVDRKDIKVSPMNHCLTLMDKYYTEIEKNKDKISVVKTAADLQKAKEGGVHAILSIEGAEVLEGSLAALRMYYRMGVRLITLTWNYANELADGICESRGGGLTEFGRQAVALMEELGILIDVSHLSEKGFWDVVECTKYPFVASHSCVKNICGHIRNLTDEQISEIIRRNGVIGINFYPQFLDNNGECGIDKLCEHIEYILSMNGENTAALGSDFDGVDCLPSGICGAESMKDICKRLSASGINDDVIQKIAFDNLYRVFYQTFNRKND